MQRVYLDVLIYWASILGYDHSFLELTEEKLRRNDETTVI